VDPIQAVDYQNPTGKQGHSLLLELSIQKQHKNAANAAFGQEQQPWASIALPAAEIIHCLTAG
jgi:hypothetical protein